ncbi:MAG: EAL domain-containing protein [Lachnospiraceae bacterium]|nr:EAL domain-containing protein [Lachnospiraceae bacterium]
MKKYEYDKNEQKLMRKSPIPYVVYQFVHNKVVIISFSDGFSDLIGVKRKEAGEALKGHMHNNIHPKDVARVGDLLHEFVAGAPYYDVVYRYKAKGDAHYKLLHAYGKHFNTADGTELSIVWYMEEGCFAQTNSEDGELLDELKNLAKKTMIARENHYDLLTGLPNMSYFFTLATEGRNAMNKKGKTTAFLFVDIIGMKFFNSKYGMEEGENLIHALGRLLVHHFGLDCCGRFGRDHFVVYADAEGLKQKLTALFKDVKVANNKRSSPIRVGIYEDIYGDVSVSLACDRAKIACDQDKNTYVSSYHFYDEELRKKSMMRDYVLTHLDDALSEGWIQVYYQPIIRSVSGMVCNEEALARWKVPDGMNLSPGEFIRVLEDAKLIYKLDLRVVELVIAHMKEKEEAGIELVPVSVNLSRHDLFLCDMVKEISTRMDKAGLDHSLLNVEITESVTGVDVEFLKKVIIKFHRAGFKVWMDDFGSEYSSLNTLHEFDFDLVKFDIKFMKDVETSDKTKIILSQLIEMAAKLGVETIVEGVETAEQAGILLKMGCHKQQGFFYQKPLSIGQLVEVYTKGNGLIREKKQERSYYRTISMVSLLKPDIKEEGLIGTCFTMVPVGVIEYRDDEFYILRGNKTYVDFLYKADFVSDKKKLQNSQVLIRMPEPNFVAAVKKAVASDSWVELYNSVENGIKSNVLLRKVSEDPVTKAVAIMIIVLAA